ncbi:MAG: GNAT family N-acetyltransferase [Erythrobacter sp.]|uniref:GNAT family N-acetyltransferase n=1 Tax=Erythrobacter sp. TaxID=1042 RepID=UPI001B0E4286|nr:GNAT family N-acetyltransferase [Erythrobacter sp.]
MFASGSKRSPATPTSASIFSSVVEYVRLVPGDADRLEELNLFFARVFPDPEVLNCEGASAQQRAAWLADDGNLALVALESSEIVGGLVAYRFDKIEGRREFYIYDLAVAEAYRRRGIATRLIEALCRIARDAGAWVVYVQADQADAPAVALYTKLGAREDVLHFDIDPKVMKP